MLGAGLASGLHGALVLTVADARPLAFRMPPKKENGAFRGPRAD